MTAPKAANIDQGPLDQVCIFFEFALVAVFEASKAVNLARMQTPAADSLPAELFSGDDLTKGFCLLVALYALFRMARGTR